MVLLLALACSTGPGDVPPDVPWETLRDRAAAVPIQDDAEKKRVLDAALTAAQAQGAPPADVAALALDRAMTCSVLRAHACVVESYDLALPIIEPTGDPSLPSYWELQAEALCAMPSGDLDRARALYGRSIGVLTERIGDDRRLASSIADSHEGLAACFAARSMWADAEAAYLEAVAIRDRSRGRGSSSRHVPWSTLLWRTFDVVGAACPVCGPVMRLRAVVRGPETGRLRDGDAAVRLPGGVAPRIRYSRVGSREIRCGSRRRGDPDGTIQGAVERLDETAMALVFPIPTVSETRSAATASRAMTPGSATTVSTTTATGSPTARMRTARDSRAAMTMKGMRLASARTVSTTTAMV